MDLLKIIKKNNGFDQLFKKPTHITQTTEPISDVIVQPLLLGDHEFIGCKSNHVK